MRRHTAGYTLIELVIAVSIAAILAKIGFDNYRNYIVRSNRAVARVVLTGLTAKQETYNQQNQAYATTFTPLNGYSGSPTTSFYINRDGAVQTASDGNTIYQISLTTSATTPYTLQAVAQGSQANWDASCQTLAINSTGLKTATTAAGTNVTDPTQCWEK
ncbi:MAG: type IV pilin protein [Nevskia sp.]|nr:type IV pilin protein [Nevskia sp.]